MDHGDMDLHAELFQVVSDYTDPEVFKQAVARLEDNHGIDVYAELLSILANIKITAAASKVIWNAAWEHRDNLSERLERSVDFSVALLDYLLVEGGNYFHRPKIIDMGDYRKIEQSAIYDGLTGVYNPGYIREQVSWEISKDRRYHRGGAIILFDLNKFKQCNDQYGHLAGDMVLKEFATILKTHTRRTDMVGRYGGDEFLVLMPTTPMEGAFLVSDRIRQSFEEKTIQVPNGPPEGIQVTVTGGIAEYISGNRDSMDDLIDAADQALYLGKDEGANRIYMEWLTNEETIYLEPDWLKSARQIEYLGFIPPKTIGKLKLSITTSLSFTAGQVVECCIQIPECEAVFTFSCIIYEVTPQDDKTSAIHCQPIERELQDWLSFSNFLLEFWRFQRT